MFERTIRHGNRDRFADGTAICNEIARHAQHVALGFIGIDDEASLNHLRTARNLGEKPGYESACARFRQSKFELALIEFREKGSRRAEQSARKVLMRPCWQ